MNIFSRIRIPKLGKNNFDLSFENKLTCQMGQLVPIVCQEVLPGDEFKMESNILVRFNPLLAPMMHRVDVYTHFFFVPNRLVWNEWEEFITGGEDGTSTPEKPTTSWRELLKQYSIFGPGTSTPTTFEGYSKIGPGSLLDYMGYNFGLSKEEVESIIADIDSIEFDWLDEPFDIIALRAYALIYNEYYRNQNTQPEIPFSKDSGFIYADISNPLNDSNELYCLTQLRYRNWSLDYFTSALPFSQRGPEQLVPVTGSTGVKFNFNSPDTIRNSTGTAVDGEILNRNNQNELRSSTYVQDSLDNGLTQVGQTDLVSIDNTKNLSVDYDNASITIRDLRRAERIQEWQETSARSGSRYIEQIKGHFGIFSSDKRLDRPEYLGGGKQVVQISAVDQTSATDFESGSTPLGSMAGKAISGGTTNGFKTKEMEEHGFIIGIMSVLPKGGYHQGLNRKFSRFDKLDYFWPEFQNIGDQEIKSKELFFAQTKNNENVMSGFGYTPRYSEYKVNHDEVHGDFKTTLDFWHLNRKFSTIPRLNGAFSSTFKNIRQDIFAVQTDVEGNPMPNMMIDIFNNITGRRCMLYYEDPSL